MLNRESTYTYTPVDESAEKVGELLTDIITVADLQGVDPSDHKQTSDVAAVLEGFGSYRSIAEEPLELARMIVANRVYGWLPPANDMLTEWETAHKGYIDLNNGTPTPAVALAVKEQHPDSQHPYGYYMSINEAEALMLNFLRLKKPSIYTTPNLWMNYEGYGTRFFDHGRVWPSALGNLTEQLPYMLLRSVEKQQPISGEVKSQFNGTLSSTLHFALGKQAVLAFPDHLKATGRFTDEILLQEMGRMGIPLKHSNLYANHEFDSTEREAKTQELKTDLIKALLFMGSITMPYEVRGQVALYGIDALQLAADIKRDFSMIGSTLPSLRKDNAVSFQARTGHTKYTLPGDDRLNGVSVELAAWQREIEGYDEDLVEYALAIGELF